jgi:hypothetical protein
VFYTAGLTASNPMGGLDEESIAQGIMAIA